MNLIHAAILTLLLDTDGQPFLPLRKQVAERLGRRLSLLAFEASVTALEGQGLLVKRPPMTRRQVLSELALLGRLLREPPGKGRKALGKVADDSDPCRLTTAGRIAAIACRLEPLVPPRERRLVRRLYADSKAVATEVASKRVPARLANCLLAKTGPSQ